MENNSISGATRKRILYIVGGALVLIALAAGIYLTEKNRFCFDFKYDTQFGDKKDFEKASNEGFTGPRGIMYYMPETAALQKALEKEGFAIDDFEKTGGGVYLSSFFGPSTKSAVVAFQNKYDLAPTGEVDNNMIDVLRKKYGCTAPKQATTTPYR